MDSYAYTVDSAVRSQLMSSYNYRWLRDFIRTVADPWCYSYAAGTGTFGKPIFPSSLPPSVFSGLLPPSMMGGNVPGLPMLPPQTALVGRSFQVVSAVYLCSEVLLQ
jgi:hypothetical protein